LGPERFEVPLPELDLRALFEARPVVAQPAALSALAHSPEQSKERPQ
jgi:hypothetical protein